MPSKAETKSIKAEVRGLKSTLTARRKVTMREIVAHRKTAREATRQVNTLEAALGRYEKDVSTRLAILEGRLAS